MQEGGFNIGKDILTDAVKNSISAFQKMANTSIVAQDLTFGKYNPSLLNLSRNERFLLLKTELIGAVSGINYIMFSQNEAKILCEHAVEEPLTNHESRVQAIDFLKELENVTAASAVSIISEKLDLDLFGDIPKVHGIQAQKVKQVFENELFVLRAHSMLFCQFKMPKLDIAPRSFWFFNDAFITRVNSMKKEIKRYA